VQFSRQFPSGNETKPHSISSEEKNKNRKWTEEEITASVDAYVEMLKKEITGKPYRKTEYNAKLRKNHLNNRTKASVELRMQNISAVFDELGLVWIKGYKPRKHVGSKVKQMIIRVIQSLDNTTLMLISSQRDNYSKTDYWWESDPEEKYWLELTDRVDIGTNLHTPQTNQSGKEFWGYSFVKLTQPGDVVFHFDKRKGAIVAFSVVADLPVREERIKWVARGKSAKGIIRHWRPGWMRSFSNHFILEKPITLANFRDQGNNIKKMVDSIPLNLSKKKALYFPFELKSSRPMRPMQGYVFKFPKSMIDIFPELMIATPAPIPKVEGRHANYDDDYDTDLKIKIL
jgi:hypothetical protein